MWDLLRCGTLALLIAGSPGCGRQSPGDAASNRGEGNKSNTVRILKKGLPGEPRTLDPQLADDTFSFPVLRDLYEGLTAEDRSGKIVPGAASSWSVDKTGTVYTFTLRPDAKWSNGDRTVAAEFVQGLRRGVDPQAASGSAAWLSVIKGANDIIAGRKKVADLGVAAIDDSTVQIQLEHPAPFVLQVLSQPIAAPVHAGGTAGVYNGPYSLVSRITGSYIELARNPNYWDAAHVPIEKIRYVNAESEATELREYIAGELDMTWAIPAPDLERVTQKYGAEIQTAPILGTLYLALDLSEPPLRGNSDLRQALSMALDRELIADHVILGVTPAYSFVADGISGYQPPAYEWSTWTRERQLTVARELFARAGYSAKKPLHLTLYFNSGESIQRLMIAIAGSWKQNLGVDSTLVSDEFRVFLTGRKDRGRWDVARLGWYADFDDPSSFLDAFASSDSQNDPSYASPEFDRLTREARAEADPDKRLALLHRSEEVLLGDYPIIPVYFYKTRRLVKPYVGGAAITPLNHSYSKHLFWNSAP